MEFSTNWYQSPGYGLKLVSFIRMAENLDGRDGFTFWKEGVCSGEAVRSEEVKEEQKVSGSGEI